MTRPVDIFERLKEQNCIADVGVETTWYRLEAQIGRSMIHQEAGTEINEFTNRNFIQRTFKPSQLISRTTGGLELANESHGG